MLYFLSVFNNVNQYSQIFLDSLQKNLTDKYREKLARTTCFLTPLAPHFIGKIFGNFSSKAQNCLVTGKHKLVETFHLFNLFIDLNQYQQRFNLRGFLIKALAPSYFYYVKHFSVGFLDIRSRVTLINLQRDNSSIFLSIIVIRKVVYPN